MPEQLRPVPVTYVKGMVFDQQSKQALEAKIQIINLKTGEFAFDDVTDAVAGEFLATMTPGNSFALNVSKSG